MGRNRTFEPKQQRKNCKFFSIFCHVLTPAQVSVYVNVEPCIMCAAALLKLRVSSIYYGAANEKFGGEMRLIVSSS